MSAFNSGEKLLIKDSNKPLKRYGSTCNHVKRTEYYVSHKIQKTDTLQGIALKYNTTTEQIRRVNRLFATDSLFLRESLKIPVSKEEAETLEGASACSSSSGSTSDSVCAPFSNSTESYSDEEQQSANHFLCKIDSVIASTKAQVNHVQKHSYFVDPNDATVAKIRSSRRQIPTILESGATDVPQPVILSHGRQVRNSLQRLEKEQDALFEL